MLLFSLFILFVIPYIAFQFVQGETYDTIYYICNALILILLSYKYYTTIHYRYVIKKAIAFIWVMLITVINVNFIVSNHITAWSYCIGIVMVIMLMFLIRKYNYKIPNYKSDTVTEGNAYFVFYKATSFKSFIFALIGGYALSGCFVYVNGYTYGFKRGKGFVKAKSSGVFKSSDYVVVKSFVNKWIVINKLESILASNKRYKLINGNCYSIIKAVIGSNKRLPYSIFMECLRKKDYISRS